MRDKTLLGMMGVIWVGVSIMVGVYHTTQLKSNSGPHVSYQYVEDKNDEEKDVVHGVYEGDTQDIVLDNMAQGRLQSPLHLSGMVRGNWFFEASFPVRLIDEDGRVLALGLARPFGEWMTAEMIPFEVDLTFDVQDGTRATLLLENDNPSGLPEHARSVRVPVVISASDH